MTRRRKRRDINSEINFWQSSSDLLIALILLLLLALMLLSLYIIQIRWAEYSTNNNQQQAAEYRGNQAADNSGRSDVDADQNKNEAQDRSDQEHDNDSEGAGGTSGAGGAEGEAGESEEGEETDDGLNSEPNTDNKAAVFVTVIDAETKKNINKQGTQFELYSEDDSLQTLSTYYPDKITYKKYETRKNGSFFLPEKIALGEYYLKQLDEIEGYDIAEKTEFSIEDVYDWPMPLEVVVPLFPERDTIKIQMSDAETEAPVAGGSFDVIATENITTNDGTIRYKKGDVVDTIKCDEKGYGESKRLFLGTYSLKQKKIPEFYANTTEVISKDLNKQKAYEEKNGKDAESVVTEIKAERTKIHFILSDELTGDPLSGVEFKVNGASYTTGDNGGIDIDTVYKSTEYKFEQVSSTGDYKKAEPVVVKVSANGRINKKADATIEASNRLLRVNIAVKSYLVGNRVSGKELQLYKGDELLRTWESDVEYIEFTDLEEGKYTVTLGKKAYPVDVGDTAELQYYDIRIFTMESLAAILAFILVISIIVVLFRKIRKRRREKISG